MTILPAVISNAPHDDFGVYRFFSHLFTAMDCIFHHIL